jgi:plasmid stabilization system protein ParE
VIQTSPYQRDFARILNYLIDQDAVDVAQRFVAALDETLAFIADFPDLGHSWESRDARSQGIRYKPVIRFPNYLVFYRQTPNGILIKRLFHGSQDIQRALSTPPST